MKKIIHNLLITAIDRAYKTGELLSAEKPEFVIQEPKKETHGDFSTNIAMVSAPIQKMPPKKIADIVIKHIDDDSNFIKKCEIAGPGFINFFIDPNFFQSHILKIYNENENYGSSKIGNNQKIMVEFVSANPTGPLHVGHGRGAAVGDTLANILSFCGYNVTKEYYINDSGRQIKTLGRSVYLRLSALYGKKVDWPDDCYQGDYIVELASEFKNANNDYLLDIDENNAINELAKFAAKEILQGIENDLKIFNIEFDSWFSEQSLFDNDSVTKTINEYRSTDLIYEKDGALWFRTTQFDDEKDRVVIRNNGLTTYFASDIAYHNNKFNRGFDTVIDVWGADHHGYVKRLEAAVQAFGIDKDKFKVVLVQLVNLLRDGQPCAMSTRSGEFVTLREVINEVGVDAARFIFLMRSHDSHLDFDLELAKKQSNENPVYYVQYVHARISSIISKASDKEIDVENESDLKMNLLVEPDEIKIIKILYRFPELIEQSAIFIQPHKITYYLMELASFFHAYYNKHKVISEDIELTRARLFLIKAIQIVIKNGLTLIGVSAPERM